MRLPRSVAILGTGLDIRYRTPDGKRVLLGLKGYTVSSDLDKKTVWIWPTPKRESRKSLDQVPRAAELRRLWSQLEPDTVLAGRPRPGKTTETLGEVISIGYRSDKWSGVNEDYQHDYKAGPTLKRSGNVLVLRGGNQRVTPAGIKG